MNGYGSNENCIEWINNDDRVTVSLSQKSKISKIEKYAKQRPDECKIIARNDDGTICAHVPRSWVKISPKKQVSEKQRIAAGERLARLRK
jgi:hypothetical protein